MLGPHVLEVAAVLHDVGGHGVDQEARAPILGGCHLHLGLCTALSGSCEARDLVGLMTDGRVNQGSTPIEWVCLWWGSSAGNLPAVWSHKSSTRMAAFEIV